MIEKQRLEHAIATLEAQRLLLGEAVVELALQPLRQQLAALEAQPGETRRYLAVLFAGIRGYESSLDAASEGSNSEETIDLLNQLWQELDPLIEAHGGKIDKHIGSSVMALWGSQAARENDVEQAARAALAMRQELARLRPELQLQAGLHYGLAVVGEVGATGEVTAIGDTVNTASRLYHAAGEGAILVSQEIYRQVRGLFDLQALAPLTVKGKAEPLRVYQVQAARSGAQRQSVRGVEGVQTEMVGRQAELTQLQHIFEQAHQQGCTQVALILGEAGVGKSRLVHEFRLWLEEHALEPWLLRGRASPQTMQTPYALLRELFAARFDIRDSDENEVVFAKLERGLAALLNLPLEPDAPSALQVRAHFLGSLLGYELAGGAVTAARHSDARQLHDRALNYLVEFFIGLAQLSPVVVLLEDLHWADVQSLQAMQQMARKCPNLPLLVVGVARPSLYERIPNWDELVPNQTRLNLRRLTADQSLLLAQQILQRAQDVPPELYGLIIERAEGNPFFIEELIKMLIDDGVIVVLPAEGGGASNWRFALERLSQMHIPSTLVGVLQARLDGLAPAEKAVLQRAAVVGRTFWQQAIDFLETASPAGESLESMEQRELVFRRSASAFEETSEYIFKHALMRDVAYESVLKRQRRAYHARAARWLELATQRRQRSGEYAAQIAGHYEQAGEALPAAAWYSRAGEHANARYALSEAVQFYRKALELLPESEAESRCQALLHLDDLYNLLGKRTQQLETLQRLEQTLAAWPNPLSGRYRIMLHLRRAGYAESTGNYGDAIAAAEQGLTLARAIAEMRLAAACLLSLGQAYAMKDDYVNTNHYLEQALRLAGEYDLQEIEIASLRSLGRVMSHQSEYAKAREYFLRSLNLARLTQNRRGESDALISLGAVALDLNDYDTAVSSFEHALHLKREIGDRRGESRALGNLGYVASDHGNYARSRQYFEQARQIFHELGDRQAESVALVNLGADALAQGDYPGALAYQQQALRIQEEIGHPHGSAIALDNISLIYYHLGDWPKALEQADQALALMRSLGAPKLEGYSLHHHGHILAALGRLEEAEQFYDQARRLRHELGEHTLATEATAGLAAVCLRRGQVQAALVWVEEILTFLQHHRFDGMVEPMWVYWICCQVLQAASDTRYRRLLGEAYSALHQRAEKISDEGLRQSFLNNVVVHRNLIEAYQQADKLR